MTLANQPELNLNNPHHVRLRDEFLLLSAYLQGSGSHPFIECENDGDGEGPGEMVPSHLAVATPYQEQISETEYEPNVEIVDLDVLSEAGEFFSEAFYATARRLADAQAQAAKYRTYIADQFITVHDHGTECLICGALADCTPDQLPHHADCILADTPQPAPEAAPTAVTVTAAELLALVRQPGEEARSEWDVAAQGRNFGDVEHGFSEACEIIERRIHALIAELGL